MIPSEPGRAFSRCGILFLVSAPSGAGKTTLRHALRETPDFVYSISCTTRPPRRDEIDGEHYHFIPHDEFEERIARSAFLEFAKVHGHYYGTLRATIADELERGIDVLLDVDIQGAAQIRACPDETIRHSLVDVFLMPPTIEELQRRLQNRGTETREQLAVRLQNARREMEAWRDYRYTILSASVEEDLTRFRAIMTAERCRSAHLRQENSAAPETVS